MRKRCVIKSDFPTVCTRPITGPNATDRNIVFRLSTLRESHLVNPETCVVGLVIADHKIEAIHILEVGTRRPCRIITRLTAIPQPLGMAVENNTEPCAIMNRQIMIVMLTTCFCWATFSSAVAASWPAKISADMNVVAGWLTPF